MENKISSKNLILSNYLAYCLEGGVGNISDWLKQTSNIALLGCYVPGIDALTQSEL